MGGLVLGGEVGCIVRKERVTCVCLYVLMQVWPNGIYRGWEEIDGWMGGLVGWVGLVVCVCGYPPTYLLPMYLYTYLPRVWMAMMPWDGIG